MYMYVHDCGFVAEHGFPVTQLDSASTWPSESYKLEYLPK